VDTVIVHLAVRNETNLYVIEHEKRNNKKQRSIIYDAAAQRRAAPRRAPSFVSGGLLLSHLWRFGDAVLSEHRGSYKSVHEGWPGPCRPAHNTPKGVTDRKGPGRDVISCMVRLDHEYPEWQFGSRLSFRSRLGNVNTIKGIGMNQKVSGPAQFRYRHHWLDFGGRHGRLILPRCGAINKNKKNKSKSKKQKQSKAKQLNATNAIQHTRTTYHNDQRENREHRTDRSDEISEKKNKKKTIKIR
jgi:Mitochondrial ribosomal protein L37